MGDEGKHRVQKLLKTRQGAGGGPSGPETHVSTIPGEMGLQAGLSLIEKNKTK